MLCTPISVGCVFILSFGQVLTAVAYSLFARESVDIAVIEVSDFILTPMFWSLYFFSMPLSFCPKYYLYFGIVYWKS